MSNRPNRRGNRPLTPSQITFNEGLSAQATAADRYAYMLATMQKAALVQTLHNAIHRDPDLVEGIDYDPAKQTEEEALIQYKAERPATFYTPEEVAQNQVPCTEEDRLEANRASALAADQLAQEARSNPTIQHDLKVCHDLGVLSVQAAIALGENYENWLSTIPADDPLREEKAKILTLYDTDSKAGMLLVATKDIQQTHATEATSWKQKDKKEQSFLKDCEILKTMTVGDYCSETLMTPEQTDTFLAEASTMGIPCHRGTNAYDFFVKKYQVMQRREDYTDEAVSDMAFNSYYKDLIANHTAQGRKQAMEDLPPEQRRKAEIGATFFDSGNYNPPKELRGFIEEAKEITRRNRVQKMNEAYQQIEQTVQKKTSLNVTTEGPMAPTYTPPQPRNDFERYIQKHSGYRTMGGTLDEKREHLAKSLAASALKDAGRKYSVKDIHNWAKQIQDMGPFRTMNEKQVMDALCNQRTMDETRQTISKKMFGVAEDRQAAYINQMKSLGRNMFPDKDASPAYKKLVSSIKTVGSLDRQDPDFELKFLAANEGVMNAIKSYSKGKKSVRTFEDGRSKFDNCLDALSIINDNIPGLKEDCKKLVDRTNEVRKVKEGDDDFVDLDFYGSKRAQAENEMRPAEKKNVEQEIQL